MEKLKGRKLDIKHSLVYVIAFISLIVFVSFLNGFLNEDFNLTLITESEEFSYTFDYSETETNDFPILTITSEFQRNNSQLCENGELEENLNATMLVYEDDICDSSQSVFSYYYWFSFNISVNSYLNNFSVQMKRTGLTGTAPFKVFLEKGIWNETLNSYVPEPATALEQDDNQILSDSIPDDFDGIKEFNVSESEHLLKVTDSYVWFLGFRGTSAQYQTSMYWLNDATDSNDESISLHFSTPSYILDAYDANINITLNEIDYSVSGSYFNTANTSKIYTDDSYFTHNQSMRYNATINEDIRECAYVYYQNQSYSEFVCENVVMIHSCDVFGYYIFETNQTKDEFQGSELDVENIIAIEVNEEGYAFAPFEESIEDITVIENSLVRFVTLVNLTHYIFSMYSIDNELIVQKTSELNSTFDSDYVVTLFVGLNETVENSGYYSLLSNQFAETLNDIEAEIVFNELSQTFYDIQFINVTIPENAISVMLVTENSEMDFIDNTYMKINVEHYLFNPHLQASINVEEIIQDTNIVEIYGESEDLVDKTINFSISYQYYVDNRVFTSVPNLLIENTYVFVFLGVIVTLIAGIIYQNKKMLKFE